MTLSAVAAALAAVGCSSGLESFETEFRDPSVGAVPGLRDAAISVLVLPGNGLDVDGAPTDGLDCIECALWSSGDVVWSDGAAPGAPPHRHARLSPERVASLAAELSTRIEGTTQRTFDISDTTHEQICVRSGGRELLLVSCHELFEANANLVAASYGVLALDGRTRAEVLAGEPAEFLTFRRTWSDVRSALHAAMPKDGELVDRAKLATLGVR